MTTADTIRLDQLDTRVRAVWLREQVLHLLAGLLTMCRWVVPLFLLGVLIDWLTYTPPLGRAAMGVVVIGVPLTRAWAVGWRHLRPFNAVRTALRIEDRHGELKSLLVSAIQLRADAQHAGGSSALRDRTCQLAEEAALRIQPEQAVPYRPLRNPGLGAMVAAGALVAFAAVNAPFFAAGLQRIFTPWVAAQYPTHTQIALEHEGLVVKEGDAAVIQARISGRVPEQATIAVRTGEGRARDIDLPITDGRCAYTLDSASRNFTYRIKAGDDRTDWHPVRVVGSPRLDQVAVTLGYPAYLQREPQTLEALTLSVPEGADLTWRLELDRPIRAARFIAKGQPSVDLPVADDGRTVTFSRRVAASQGYNFEWVDKDNGFRFTSPRYYLQVDSDQAPRVELTAPPTNLIATVGRPLRPAIRAYDDHGIATTSVRYRVNQRGPTTVHLDQPGQPGQGDQPIDWDYRDAAPDLKVGDTVSFSVEVSDRYPGTDGPHVARSDTRRISFVSKDDYLKQIEKQTDRLLARVQRVYRQQRSAHHDIRQMSPDQAGYAQACQLEAIRQEMMRDQLHDIADGLGALLDDLAANNLADASQAATLSSVREALGQIGESHIAGAADRLRTPPGPANRGEALATHTHAADAVNAAARELASLVLLRGIDSAQEVYAREARMLASEQARLRWQTASSTSGSTRDTDRIARRQEQLAQWTDRLISELLTGIRFDKRPLAVLRLVRSVKDLRDAGTVAKLREAGARIRSRETERAVALQQDQVRALLNAEFSVRLTGAYATLLKTKDEIRLLAQAQRRLEEQTHGVAEQVFEQRQAELIEQQRAMRRRLLTLLLPTVPAPRARLFDEAMPTPPPVDRLLSEADRAMTRALAHLSQDDPQAASAQQRHARQVLDELSGIVDRWSVQMGLQTQGLGTVVAASSDRLGQIEDFEARVIGLLEKTDIAAARGDRVDDLAEPQFILSEELAGLHQDLARPDRDADQARDLTALLSRLKQAEQAMNAGIQSLRDNKANQAIAHQERAADALARARAQALAQNERLSLLQDLLLFQRAVGFANRYMADLVAEQRDLLEASESATPADVPELLPAFDHLRRCMTDIAPLLDLVAGRLDVGTPLAFARTDFEDAAFSLEAGDTLDAIDAQDVAAQSLAQVQALVQAIRTETGYVAELVAYLDSAASETAAMAHRQSALRDRAASAQAGRLQGLAQDQAALLAQAQQHGKQLEVATGMPRFTDATEQMQQALDRLNTGDAAAAGDAMASAAVGLSEDGETLFDVIRMLHGLPSIEVMPQTEPALVRLVEALSIASEQRHLSRTTQSTAPNALAGLEAAQGQLAERSTSLADAGPAHPLLTAAQSHLAGAVTAMRSGDRAALRPHQRSADTLLRHFIVDQALILETAVPPPTPQEGLPTDDGPGSDSESAIAAGFISDFVSGEAPEDQRTEWKVLGDRNRAALNQNFARELPLEYRGLLKDYYEKVAE